MIVQEKMLALRPVLDFNPGVSDDHAINLREKDGVVSPPHHRHEKVTNLTFVSKRLKIGRVDMRVEPLHLRIESDEHVQISVNGISDCNGHASYFPFA
jgi:hypothetical protein